MSNPPLRPISTPAFPSDPASARRVVAAMESYRLDGNHVVMNAIVRGHRTLSGFLQMRQPANAVSPEAVRRWCERLIADHGGDAARHAPRLPGEFENEAGLRGAMRALDDFLRSCSPIWNVTVIKGIRELSFDSSDDTSTAVNGRDYVRSLLSRQPILYDEFLSTSCDPHKALQFANEDVMDNPLYKIDLNDASSVTEHLRQRALADLADTSLKDQTASLLLVLRAQGARGMALPRTPDSRAREESEILFSSGHVVLPRMAIRCEAGYVFFADLRHRETM